ncbi:hypothetical protein Q8791_23635 [Nocardiopsis sp. CT-R113]|uniref:Uncharacterized protein n=1 Tax=Nocardiopsis codii TaxID=3065942 RepID=A0ABU7KF42_9ACTN|nr:hypothetical protein [Nocardiopsis sp. CT-R113]MEE2040212.1 hypothetical protein [Nocardiopsis sp. CT-R113]
MHNLSYDERHAIQDAWHEYLNSCELLDLADADQDPERIRTGRYGVADAREAVETACTRAGIDPREAHTVKTV